MPCWPILKELWSILQPLARPPASGTGVTLTLSPSALPNGVFDILYNQTLSVSGGTSPYTFAVTSGTLPLGLSLTGNKIFGQSQAIEVAVFTITSTDSLGNTGSRNYELGIDGAGGGCTRCACAGDCHTWPSAAIA